MDLFTLTKPEISFLVAISVLAGFLIGAPAAINWVALVGTVVGTVLASGGACVLNHYMEWEYDGAMKRTAARPIPGGRISPTFAFRYGAGLCIAGIALLCPLTNWLTASLAIATVALYLAAYTPLKRITVHNTIVGTIPGALPALGGYTAATGRFGVDGWLIFGVLVLWQLPHFYSLAWMYRKDYGRGGFAMLSVNDETGLRTAGASLVATIALVALTFVPIVRGDTSIPASIAIGVIDAWLLVAALRFFAVRSVVNARSLLKVTIRYIPLYVVAIVLQRLF